MGDTPPFNGVTHEIFISWGLPHLRTCLQTSTYPPLEVTLRPVGLAMEVKSSQRCRAVKGSVSGLTGKHGALTLVRPPFQIPARSPRECFMSSHCLCHGVPGIRGPTLQRASTKNLTSWENSVPGKRGPFSESIRPLSGNTVWNSGAGKRSPWPAS